MLKLPETLSTPTFTEGEQRLLLILDECPIDFLGSEKYENYEPMAAKLA